MFFVQEVCIKCHRLGFLRKIPEFRLKKEEKDTARKTGSVVDSFIEDAKKDLKDQKVEAKKELKQ